MTTRVERCNILSVGISAINMQQALENIGAWIKERQPHYICVTPAHAVMSCWHEPALRSIYNQSGLTTPDGMAIVWLLRWYGHRHVERVYGPDLLLAACKHFLGRGVRHYFYGGAPEASERMVQRLRTDFPGIHIAGVDSPPFRTLSQQEEEAALGRMRAANPDVVWVGLGSPRQERWMAEHLQALEIPVLVGVGAAFDFLSGCKPQAPRWMQRSGLEWLFRLLSEPRRLWRRYLDYPLFVLLAVMQRAGLKKYPLEKG